LSPLSTFNPSRIGAGAARRTLGKLFIPEQDRTCEIIDGETASEAAVKLAEKLVKEGIVR
jgi:hypothetical protein